MIQLIICDRIVLQIINFQLDFAINGIHINRIKIFCNQLINKKKRNAIYLCELTKAFHFLIVIFIFYYGQSQWTMRVVYGSANAAHRNQNIRLLLTISICLTFKETVCNVVIQAIALWLWTLNEYKLVQPP